jgi:hypothetical protein
MERGMMKSRWITYKGKRIFFVDLSGFGRHPDALREELVQAEAAAYREPEGSLLVLTDVRDTILSSEVMDFVKQSSARATKHIRKEAIIGMTGIRQVLLDAVSRFSGRRFTVFDDVEVAKDWLVSEDS